MRQSLEVEYKLGHQIIGILTHEIDNVGRVPDNKSRNIPEVVLVGRWAVGVLGIWRGRDSWVKGGANGVSLQAT